MPDGFTVDASGLDNLAHKLRRAAIEAEKEVDKTVLKIGLEIAAEAKVIASGHSTSIPPTIHVQPLKPGAVEIVAGGADVPLAGLYEIGNKGGKRTSKTFRHPVFGNRNVWVEQPRFRFFAPARSRLRKKSMKQLTDAWSRALERSGLNRG